MGSFKANGREQGSRERRNIKHARRRGLLNLEWLLEERVLLSVVWHPTSTNLADVENGPMANLGGQAISLYKAFQGGQTNSSALAKQFPLDQFQGDSVLMGLTAYTDFQGFKTSLSNLGMQIVDTNPTDGLVDGWLPINELPAAAQLPQTMSGQPDMRDVTYQAAINEADYSTFANVASQHTGLTGAGVTVGVISDSFNNQGGYAADVASGDLPSNVDVLAEATAADKGYPFDDEGRAMAQNIHHIAPGASLAFTTGEPDSQVMAQNILKLANTAGAKVIVDDLGLPDEPFFQPGLVTQAINTVTSQGVTYLSAAGNEADQGYLSNFRAATGTVTGVGTGTFMNFNPSGTNLLLPITVNEANTTINFQWDQPWATQEPMGSPGPSSQINFYVLNAVGTVIASGVNNITATSDPQQLVTVPSTGSYYVAIQLVSGPNPGHVEFTQFGQVSADDLIVSQQYGTAGGTYYPTSVGHNAAANNIGVGAVPWWSPTPFLGQNPLASEPFSSSGPEIQVFNADAAALSSPLTVQNPTVTAPDGGNITSNWPASMPFGIVANTANPPFQGEPATSSNLYATFTPNQSKLPSYFGTSSAAPNAAAIAALMLQRVSSATPAQIKDALIESAAATPMNASTPGTWNAQGGYGLINAINAIDVLRVSSTNPSNGETVTVTPSAIDVTFTKPVVFSTVTSSDLVFQATPPGVSVVVGTPQAIDNPTDPTIVAFPYSFSYKNPPTTTANGVYTFIVSGPITAETGGTLVPSSPITFTLDDTTAPEVANTSVSTRTVTIQFTKAMNPSTIKLANLYVERQGGTGNWLTPINLNSYPGVTIAYNPLTNTATLNYSALPQTDMPTDDYAIVVKSGPTGVTDLVGNELDGAFSGTFPSGNGTPGTNFFEDLGLKTLVAPVVTAFQMTAATDTGIAGDQNTKDTQPVFTGQVYSPFPGTVAGLNVYVQFNSLQPGGALNLAVGTGGRGVTYTPGSAVEQEVTNPSGSFTVAAPTLPEGLQSVGIVVVGEEDRVAPPAPNDG
ncbi:MAG: S8 family serine peptidase, partial [Isosphaeraceae bacterium]